MGGFPTCRLPLGEIPMRPLTVCVCVSASVAMSLSSCRREKANQTMTGSWSPKRRMCVREETPWSSAFSTLQNALSYVKLADIGIPVAIAPHESQSGDDRSRGHPRQASADRYVPLHFPKVERGTYRLSLVPTYQI